MVHAHTTPAGERLNVSQTNNTTVRLDSMVSCLNELSTNSVQDITSKQLTTVAMNVDLTGVPDSFDSISVLSNRGVWLLDWTTADVHIHRSRTTTLDRGRRMERAISANIATQSQSVVWPKGKMHQPEKH